MILSDSPITNEKQDQLKRAPLAKKVAQIINNYEANESFVIGVEGAWGSGKTSFVNLTLNNLDTECATYFVFNPWNFSDETSLLRDFFVQLSRAVEDVVGKSLGEKVRSYATRIADIDLMDELGFWGKLVKSIISIFSKDQSLQSLRKDLDRELSKVNKKIVVVIDDIDRLDQKETKLIFKLVKLTANFQNTVFVLSYDREQVEKRITDKEAGMEGGDYLRKIVQVSFTLPVPDQQELRAILFKDLDKTIKDLYPNEDILKDKNEESRWSDLLYHGFGDLFSSVRDIKRYISSLRLDWPIVGTADVNKIDFLGIEAMRVFAPLFYNSIPANEDIFIRSYKYRNIFANETQAAEDQRQRFDELLSEFVPKKEREHIKAICGQLFPQLQKYGGHYSEETQERELMICHPDRFKFYFQLGIPHGEVSESRVKAVIESADDVESFKIAILQSNDDGNLRKLLRRLLMRRNELEKNKIRNIISVLWSLGDDISEQKEAVFDFDDIETQIMRFGYHALLEIPEAERDSFVIDLYQEATRLYHPTHLLHVLADAKRSGEVHLKDETVSSLKKIIIEKIEASATNNSLKGETKLLAILYRWQDWGTTENVSNFIRDWISTREGLLAFLQKCVGRVLSTGGNYNDLNPDSIAGLYSLEEVKKLVAVIPEEDIKNMNKKEQEAIDLFKNRPNRF